MIKLKMMENLPFRRCVSHGKPSGQALLIVLLVMAVGLTIGLSVISRSVTDIKISQQTEEAARAFSAAEAGIESALVGGSLTGSFLETGASYTAQTTDIGAGNQFIFPEEVSVDKPQTLFLVQHNADGSLNETRYYTASSLDACWGGTAALEVIIYYKDGSSYKVARGAYDPDPSRRTTNSFSPPDNGSCAELNNKKTLNFINDFSINPTTKTLLFLRLRILYANVQVGVVTAGSGSGQVLPAQGISIDSTGTSGTATRKVQVVRFYPAPPAIFDSVLYSQGDLVK